MGMMLAIKGRLGWMLVTGHQPRGMLLTSLRLPVTDQDSSRWKGEEENKILEIGMWERANAKAVALG